MIPPELLSILCCPETRQPLVVAGPEVLASLNRRIRGGQLQNRGGQVVADTIEEGLLREDGKVLYPVRNSIPVLLVEEGLGL